ncbi:MAG: phenylalanine--tRNA ligase subunit alpha [Parcubacteria group bacterium]|nr:phenylalanine--tRNA ligase subunit alpha [Parcubacteria group bacterium]MCR4342392.1 phenylalanine--tRNA ligase subunit alpha [Patescibacteria group bacterium]
MINNDKNWIDVSAPGKKAPRGHLHPLTQITDKISDIFSGMGFEIAEGPQIEDEWHNFDALNVPKDHPARDMQDTFWIKDRENKLCLAGEKSKKGEKLLLRTHTSSVQIRYMKNLPIGGHPIRIIAPGRVFRYEATDMTHESQFYQFEGLMVDKNINLANLKAIIEVFFQRFYNSKDIEVRLRPSYFPFVEPGVEIDIRRGRNGKWLEVGGAGMVHPRVLESVGLDPREYRGFAFGMGVDRLAMLKYKIDDVRLFYSGDLRFIKQF